MSVRCPDCRQANLDEQGVCPKCGASDDQQRDRAAPRMPMIGDAYRLIAAEIARHRGRMPAGMPADPDDAAHWMLHRVLERHQAEEAPQRRSKTEGKGDAATVKWFWVWPYLTRIKIQLHQFLALTEDEQRYILAAREDAIPWRGDPMDFFRQVVHAAFEMGQTGKGQYVATARQLMKQQVGGLGS